MPVPIPTLLLDRPLSCHPQRRPAAQFGLDVMQRRPSRRFHWLREGGLFAFALFVGSFAYAAASTEGAAVRDATSSARYVPALSSKVDEKWGTWVQSADEVIRVAGGAAHAKANATDIVYEALRAGLEPELVFALVEVSSRFDEHAVSRKGGIGLLVLSRHVHERFGNRVNTLFMGKYNLRLGCSLLRRYIDLENGNLNRALQRFFEEASLAGAGADEFTRTYQARRAILQPSSPLPR